MNWGPTHCHAKLPVNVRVVEQEQSGQHMHGVAICRRTQKKNKQGRRYALLWRVIEGPISEMDWEERSMRVVTGGQKKKSGNEWRNTFILTDLPSKTSIDFRENVPPSRDLRWLILLFSAVQDILDDRGTTIWSKKLCSSVLVRSVEAMQIAA